MKIVKYFDRIHKALLDLEVSDELAQFLNTNRVYRHRQKKKINNFEMYTDNFSSWIDNIGSEENIETTLEQKELAKIVRKNIVKLSKQRQEIIYRLFYLDQNKTEVAKTMGITLSCLSQQLETIFWHLTILLIHDKDFKQYDKYTKEAEPKDFSHLDIDKNGKIYSPNPKDNVQEIIKYLRFAMDEHDKQQRILKKLS